MTAPMVTDGPTRLVDLPDGRRYEVFEAYGKAWIRCAHGEGLGPFPSIQHATRRLVAISEGWWDAA